MKATETNILIYQADDGETHLEVQLDHETVWLTQRQIAELFDVKVPAISKHVHNIFDSGELDTEATVSKMERVRREGNRVQPGYDYFDRLLCEIAAWHPVSPVGHAGGGTSLAPRCE